MSRVRAVLIWAALLTVITVPIGAAAASPLLAWRDPIYIAAGFAGIIAMAILLVQPVLAGGFLPGLNLIHARRIHRRTGLVLVLAVVIHVAALWVTSPPDVIDVLLFASPTPFSVWGVVAMGAIFAAALMAVLRRRLALQMWRIAHMSLAVVIVVGSVVHAMLIEGTMEMMSKATLCALVLIATIRTVTANRRRHVRENGTR